MTSHSHDLREYIEWNTGAHLRVCAFCPGGGSVRLPGQAKFAFLHGFSEKSAARCG